ncbi:MAG: PspC domain-containing protein [Pseudonocardiales bacterium]|nr:PspC domain-containing protein [Pseudonocardiales bacterium]
MDGTEVRNTFREMWETRPARPRDDRKVAGVAAAIGRRYDVDPVLIRVGFVVAAFSGVGVPLYLAGWLVLPSDGAPDGRRRPHLLFGLAVLAFLSLGWAFGGDGPGGAGGILAGLVVFGLLFLLHRSRGDRRAGVAEAPQAAAPAVSLHKDLPGVDAATPPSWDPLGAAPFAWDLPEPGGPPAPPAPRRPPVTAVTLAAALLAGGVTGLLLLATGMLSAAGAPVLLGVVLAVLGAGLVVGSFLHAGRGLVPAAVVVGLLTWGSLAAPVEDWPEGGFGDLRASPVSAAQVAPLYSHTAGDVELDLSRLDLTSSATAPAPVRTGIVLGAGDVRVTVPRDADVSLVATTGAGAVTFDGESRDGIGASLTVEDNLGRDGVAGGRPLEITVHANAGDVEVLRG